MALAVEPKAEVAQPEPEAEKKEQEQLSQQELLSKLVDLAEAQTASLHIIQGHVEGSKPNFKKMVESCNHIEKATHFLELRSDASAALLSDERRHREQEKANQAELAAEKLSPAEHKARQKALRDSERLRQLDRATALVSGSCWAPFLLCLK